MRKALLSAVIGICAAGSLAAQDFTTLKGHGGPVMGLDVSPSGKVASASFDNSVGLWTGRAPAWLEGHEAAVTTVAWGPDGTLYSGGDDFAVRAWGDAPRVLGRHQGKVAALAVSPDGRTLASGSWDGSILLWPVADDAEPQTLERPGSGVNAVAFSQDGRFLFAGTSNGDLLRYDLAEGGAPYPMVQHGFGVNELVVGPDWVAYGAVDGGTRVVDAVTGGAIADFTLDRRPILAMDHHPGTNRLAVGDGHGFIMMLDTAEWAIANDFRATREGPVWALAFSSDGAIIHAGGLDDVVYAWPVAMLDSFDAEMGQERA
ncbi:WD40 repeat domain-containing protein, partial [Citreimonas sp.]|uniref:WD40 repeat domain-containing protein n=1 Tax=Citreimonas sp. TaxID=3036715 RepID=UPI0035C85E98